MRSLRIRKIVAVLLSVFMLTAAVPAVSFAADNTVHYLNRYWDAISEQLVEEDATAVNPLAFPLMQEGEHWYYVDTNKTYESRVTVPSRAIVNLIIADGVTVNCKKGIQVASSAELNIYGQAEGTGKLIASSESYNAAIGSNDEGNPSGPIRIYGGKIEATAGTDAAGIGGGNEVACGAVTIYGGEVTATGGKYGAGIGDGDQSPSAGGPVTIYGGKITAKGGQEAAGIGAGDEAEYSFGGITIWGGEITATGGAEGAGIGGGSESRGGYITINGGEIHASSVEQGAGIGGGYKRGPTKITINGGVVVATGGAEAAGIGEGYGATSETSNGVIEINGGEQITATGGRLAAGIGGGFCNNTKIKIHINGGTVTAFGGSDTCGGAGIGSGSYQSMEPNSLGGGDFAGEIIITGGDVYGGGSGSTENYYGGAGLGSGNGGNMTGVIKITGGKVRAAGDCGGAGIGAGAEAPLGVGGECEGTVEITGGSVEVITVDAGRGNGDNAVLIGHGCDGDTDGTLKLGDTLCVSVGADAPVAAAQRVSTCHSVAEAHLYIEECAHRDNNAEYIDENTHFLDCNTCLFAGPAPHYYYYGECIDCGAEGYTVTYVTKDNQLYELAHVHAGGTVTPPEDPEAEGFVFANWYEYGNEPTEAFDFSTPITDDIFLLSHWQVLTGFVAYNRTTGEVGTGGKVRFADDEAFAPLVTKNVEIGDMVQGEQQADEGYDFVGWASIDDVDTILTDARSIAYSAYSFMGYAAVFEAHTHRISIVPGYDATCEEDGEIDYYRCSVCGKLFRDGDGVTELTEEELVIPATGHRFTNYVYQDDATCTANGTEMAVCDNGCGKTDSREVPGTAKGHSFTDYVYQNDATCTANGTEAAPCDNGCGKTDSREAADTAKGHSYGEPVWTWAADHSSATAAFPCEKGDDTQTVTDNAPVRTEVSAATATQDQVVKYTAVADFNGKTYTTETENITVPGTATGEQEQPDTPSGPDTPSQSGKCKWCGKDHSVNFWQRIVGFIHSILYFFAHLFGLR